MPYSKNDIDRITELVREIESRKEHSNAAATYKDVPVLRARNYYGPDRCDDLVETAKELLSEDERKKIEKKIFEDFHPLKHDPVELTKPYLSVIDKVEQLMDTEEIKSMHHFQRNYVFRELLREYGVEWRPMTELNPGVHFD